MELAVSITRSAAETYEFLSAPENFAKCLGAPLRPAGVDWIADTAEGQVAVRLSERNSFGVLDYSLRRPNGITVYVPLRVVANGRGCELVLTLFGPPEMLDESFAVLRAAKRILDAQPSCADHTSGSAGSSLSSVTGNSRTRTPVAL